MEQKPYLELTDLELLTLCVWREARGEGMLGKRGVAHVVCNRVKRPCWWGHTVKQVILHPEQFSSFNMRDPNSSKWPTDVEPAGEDSEMAASLVLGGTDDDPTKGATHYHDISIEFPERSWGLRSKFEETLEVGRLKFYRQIVD